MVATLCAAGVWLAASSVRAEVDSFHGAFTQDLPVVVPAYHGLEPRLGLSYSSAGGHGLAGVGWSLTGFSAVERACPGGGAPKNDSTDIFLLDGQELVPCAGAAGSPGCAAGGTHATKAESYLKIKYVSGATNKWYVWQKDGRKTTYSSIMTAGGQTFRWGQTEVRDTGNKYVTYAWSCVGSEECHPDQITYNGTVVKLYRETRTDLSSRATGAGLVTTSYRLKSIDVCVGTPASPSACNNTGSTDSRRARAYKLTYTTSAGSSRSLLASVRQYGKDAKLSSGAITAGTAVPATTFAPASSGAAGFTAPTKWRDYAASPVYANWFWGGDFNGDGKQDLLYLASNFTTNGWQVMLSNGAGFNAPVKWQSYYTVSDKAWIHLADFDGDGKTDLLYLAANYGTDGWQLMRSTGTAFAAPVKWQAYSTRPPLSAAFVYTGDFNGDGKTDLIYLGASYGTDGWQLMRSTGTAFAAPVKWVSWESLYNGYEYVADFNGDGKSDLMFLGAPGGANAWRVHLSNGTTGQAAQTWGTYEAVNGDRVFLGDYNGDGKTDFLYTTYTSPKWRLMHSTGANFTAAATVSTYEAPYTWYAPYVFQQDVNGDGLLDIVYLANTTSLGWRVILNQGGGVFANPVMWRAYSTVCTSAFWVLPGDYNGDGRGDLVYLASNFNTDGWQAMLATGPEDRVASVTNPMGGTTTIGYTPSSAWQSSCPPAGYTPPADTNFNPPVVHTVTSVVTSDGRTSPSTATFSYACGLVDNLERRFLGFRYAKETLPCITGETQCPYQETWYRQDYGSAGKPDRVDRSAGNGKLYTSVIQNYTGNGATIPYTSLNSSTWAYAYDGSGTACSSWPCAYGVRTYTSRTFDTYGNTLVEVFRGNYDVSGDEKTSQMVYVPNTSLYIVGLPTVNRLFEGTTTGGTLLEEALVTYDGAVGVCNSNLMPTVGRPTCTERLASTTPSYLAVTQQYDTYGNVTAEIQPAGEKVAYLYDSTYHTFRTEIRDPAYHGLGATPADTRHKKLLSNDAICGAQTQTTEKSSLVHTYQYDALCRLTRRSDNYGSFENRTYVNAGTPTTQYVRVETPAASTAGNQFVNTYLDGLGRTYKETARGPSSYDIVAETTFTARGKVYQRSLPRYSNETAKWLTVGYDPLDRVTRTTNPGGTFATTSYGLGSVTTTDEAGLVRTEWKDGLGRVTKRRQYLGTTPLDTTYTYNARGQATQIKDPKGNLYKVTYNTLGQRATYVDPDRGTTTYYYDPNGRLTKEQDALGQRTENAYDLLGRRTQKIERRANGTVEQTITWTYDQARTGYYNVGALTTMTDSLGTASLDYDRKGHLARGVRTVDTSSYTFTYGYDAGGRLLSTTLPDADTIGTTASPLTYDGAGRPKTVPGYVTAATYTAGGQLLTLTRANGTTATYTYDANRTWLTAIDTLKGSTVIQNLDYYRDPIGRATKVTSPFAGEAWSYAYDTLGALTSATASPSSTTHNQTFSYDPAGNLTSVKRPGGSTWSYTYESAHGPTSVRPHAVKLAGSNPYTYDAVGNMLTGAGRTYTWGVNGLPKQINSDFFYYDGRGARLKKVVGALTTHYVSDDYEVTNGTVTKYVKFGGKAVAKKVGTVNYYLHHDGLGSIQAVTNASGVEVGRMVYRPFGERLSTTGSVTDARSFTGQPQDESGLIYLNARYYDPVLARFISADPTVPSATTVGLNRYAYAGNDPINNVDTDGLGLWSSIKNFFKKIIDGAKKAVKGLVTMVKAAAHGDWKAILTIAILCLTIMVGGAVLTDAITKALGAAVNSAAPGSLLSEALGTIATDLCNGEISAMTAAFQATTFGAYGVGAAAAATAAGVGFVSSFAIGYVQTGSIHAAFKAGVNGLTSAVANLALNFVASQVFGMSVETMGPNPDRNYHTKLGGPLDEILGTNSALGRAYNSRRGYFNSFIGQVQAHGHDWILEGLDAIMVNRDKATVMNTVFTAVNMASAFVSQAAFEGAVAGAFGSMKESPAAIINQLTGATTFFTATLPNSDIRICTLPKRIHEPLAAQSVKIDW